MKFDMPWSASTSKFEENFESQSKVGRKFEEYLGRLEYF